MNTVDILKRARDHIAKPGQWYQGGLSNEPTDAVGGAMKGWPCCAEGAVWWAAKGFPNRDTLKPLKGALPDDWHGAIFLFNDAPGRTQEEVVALFDRAIELAEAEQ